MSIESTYLSTKSHNNTTFAAQYQRCTQISGLFAKTLVESSGIANSTPPLVIFDNACGTGAVSSALYHTLKDEDQDISNWQLTCGDMAEAMLRYTEQRIKEEGWPNARAIVVDAQDTKLPSEMYTHVFTAFAFNLFADPKAALRECYRVLQPNGTLAISVWKQCGWFDTTKAAIARIPVDAGEDLPYPTNSEMLVLSPANKGWDSAPCIREFLFEAGFVDIEIAEVKKECVMPLDDLAEACLMMVPFILNKFWTREQRERYADFVPTAVRRYIRDTYDELGHGTGVLDAEAITVVARKGQVVVAGSC
ncbi:S-adenosyl-L-methionine-dependent methyltransferase [Aspergillus desertorum]